MPVIIITLTRRGTFEKNEIESQDKKMKLRKASKLVIKEKR